MMSEAQRHRTTVGGVLLLTFLLTGPAALEAQTPGEKDTKGQVEAPAAPLFPPGPPGVLAQVEDSIITREEVLTLRKNSKDRLPLEMALDSRILEEVARFNLTLEGFKTTPEQVEQAYEKAMKRAREQNFNLLERLSAQGITEKTFRSYLELQLLTEERFDKDESKMSVEEYFKLHRGRYIKQIRVLRLLVKLGEDESIKDGKVRAGALLERLKSGEDWVTVCRAESDHPLAPFDGGDLGWVSAQQRRSDPVMQAARKLADGEFCKEPIYALEAFHIVKVTGVRVPDIDFEAYPTKGRVKFDHRREIIEGIQKQWLKKTRVVRFAGATAPSALYPR